MSEDGPELRDAIAHHDDAVVFEFAAQEQLLQQRQVSEHCSRELGEPVLALVDANLWKEEWWDLAGLALFSSNMFKKTFMFSWQVSHR